MKIKLRTPRSGIAPHRTVLFPFVPPTCTMRPQRFHPCCHQQDMSIKVNMPAGALPCGDLQTFAKVVATGHRFVTVFNSMGLAFDHNAGEHLVVGL